LKKRKNTFTEVQGLLPWKTDADHQEFNFCFNWNATFQNSVQHHF